LESEASLIPSACEIQPYGGGIGYILERGREGAAMKMVMMIKMSVMMVRLRAEDDIGGRLVFDGGAVVGVHHEEGVL